ncbi:integrase catalytic domain-containing protein [Trichonephila clavipes]|uniref:Integrase catalytic domain-containing protein n=1 Tax=Trichonephila clavipes TaxID=2585209 RepID=A0A8X6SR36_TRICX|nr:integrase catalytic domain-containing protein [Trichonephila clavipes]
MCQVKDLFYSSSTETETLGLLWKPHPDSFAFKISPMTSNLDNLIVTKKSVIYTIARIFDPLGLIGRVITKAKILLQSLWQLKLDWNDPLPSNLVSYWISFIDALESINCLYIPCYCLQDKSIRTELHSFSDSSEKAYGAALYLRCINKSGQISVRLLCSKSKVAPLKSAEATLANIRNSFWIPSTRNVVRKILRTCIICRKVSAKCSQQLMADLPAARVTPYRVFSQVVKAIHLELVSDLTTEAFLAALKRFAARRGRPIEIHSDNGGNFVGANNELRKILKALFKVGSSLVAVPDPDYTEIPMNRLSRWQLVQKMNKHFCSKWSSEYLNRLQQRPKWCKGHVGFKEGDLVLVKPSEESDSLKWHLARILKLHPGKDNIVRVVTLKDKQGIFKRPVTKIANLP